MFSRFYRAQRRVRQGDRQTERPCNVANYRPYKQCLVLGSSSFLACTTRSAPLGVYSTIRRDQPPQKKLLGQVDCFVQCEVVVSQIALDGVPPRDMRKPRWSFPATGGGAIRIILVSTSSSIRTICPNMDYR